jgi:hypothetical protein
VSQDKGRILKDIRENNPVFLQLLSMSLGYKIRAKSFKTVDNSVDNVSKGHDFAFF